MTPSIDERRKVAERLRYVGRSGGPEWGTAACCIAECVGEDDYPLWGGSTPLFEKLADLIEPLPERTCTMHRDGHGIWHCSSCEASDENDIGIISWCDSWSPSFCPSCGAKVMEG